MEAPNEPVGFWNRATGRPFSHPLDLGRFAQVVRRDARILDYGCGPGRLCAELIEGGYTNVSGIDFSTEMIRQACERNPRVTFAVNDGHSLPFADASFDAVLLFAVLTCIPDDAAQRSLLREFKRILRPGALLLISDYPLQTDARNLGRYTEFAAGPGGYGAFRLPNGVLLRHHRREWFDELLDGFSMEYSTELDVLTMNGNPARIVQFWLKRADSPG